MSCNQLVGVNIRPFCLDVHDQGLSRNDPLTLVVVNIDNATTTLVIHCSAIVCKTPKRIQHVENGIHIRRHVMKLLVSPLFRCRM